MKEFYLYILKNLAGRHYIGITENIERRLARHNGGGVDSTKGHRPWRVLYTERHNDKTTARKRELFFKKTARARKELFEKLDEGPVV